MKYLILLMLIVLPSVASAQGTGFTPVPKETANQYYANCIKQQSPTQQMSAQSQKTMCACTAARMTQFFSIEDMKQMTGTEPTAARAAYNKMITNIYAPCMDTPTYEYYHATCINNPDTAKYGNPQKICVCLAEKMASHLRAEGPGIFQKILSRDPNIADPMAALFSDPEFNQFAQSRLLTCVR